MKTLIIVLLILGTILLSGCSNLTYLHDCNKTAIKECGIDNIKQVELGKLGGCNYLCKDYSVIK